MNQENMGIFWGKDILGERVPSNTALTSMFVSAASFYTTLVELLKLRQRKHARKRGSKRRE